MKINKDLITATVKNATYLADGVVKVNSVKIAKDKDSINLNIQLIVALGSKIPEIAWDLQNNIKTQVEAIPGMKLGKVNIYVQGVQ